MSLQPIRSTQFAADPNLPSPPLEGTNWQISYLPEAMGVPNGPVGNQNFKLGSFFGNKLVTGSNAAGMPFTGGYGAPDLSPLQSYILNHALPGVQPIKFVFNDMLLQNTGLANDPLIKVLKNTAGCKINGPFVSLYGIDARLLAVARS